MKKIKTKNLTKQIMCIIIVLMLCNFIVPNYIYAADTGDGGSLMDSISQFLCFIPDSVMNLLQDMFITPESIEVDDDTYSIKYSPGIIFSGDVPAFDINFINPNTKPKSNGNYGKYVKDNIEKFYEKRSQDFKDKYLNAKERDDNYVVRGRVKLQHVKDKYTAYYWVENDILYTACEFDAGWGIYIFGSRYNYYYHTCSITDPELQEALENVSYNSIANELQSGIATWYNALRRIALVGLLSAIVYIGIKIVQTSASAKEQAKYKNMLKEWIVALCLLFTLHYIMSITITVVDKINEVIKASSIAASGEDILMTSVRNRILNSDKWSQALTYVLIYFVLVWYTIIYTIEYLKRVAYLAFLTMIAPLITLTYPLDKIKDSKAQAFDMWIKDYVFFTLIQVVHLLIYYIFLGSAIDLAKEGNWLFAIISIGFINQAEKLIRKMFGFEKSKTLGVMSAGATGALIMNALQKITKSATKEASSKKTGSSANGGNTNLVRTVGVNPFVNFAEETSTSPSVRTGPASSTASDSSSGSSLGSVDDSQLNGANITGAGGNANTNSQTPRNSGGAEKESKLVQLLKKKNLLNKNLQTSTKGISNASKAGKYLKRDNKKNSDSWNSFKLGAKRTVRGAAAVAGKYIPQVSIGAIRLMAEATGTLIGVSGAIANGKPEELISGALLGKEAGKGAVNMVVDTAKKVERIPEKLDEMVDQYREGAYGREVAQNAKFDRVFRNSKEYKELMDSSGFSKIEFDKKVQKMLDSGITNPKQMKKILKNNKKHPRKYNMDDAIKYSNLAEQCSKDILEDHLKFIRFCQDRKLNLSEEEMAELKKNLMNFK